MATFSGDLIKIQDSVRKSERFRKSEAGNLSEHISSSYTKVKLILLVFRQLEGKNNLYQWKMAIVIRLLAPVEQQEGYLCQWLLHTQLAGRKWRSLSSSVRDTCHACPKMCPDVFILMKNGLFSVAYKCYILFLLFQKRHLTHWRFKTNRVMWKKPKF